MHLLPRRTVCTLCEDWTDQVLFVGKDQAYVFTTTGYHPKLPAGIRVSSQQQWNRLLKQRGLTDDVGISERLRRKQSFVAEKIHRERRGAFRQRVTTLMKRALRESGAR